MNNEINSSVYELGRAFASFKDANDERISQIENKGLSDPLTDIKVKRLNDEVTRATTMAESAKKQVDLVETALKRSPLGSVKSDEHEEAKVFGIERKSTFGGEIDVNTF